MSFEELPFTASDVQEVAGKVETLDGLHTLVGAARQLFSVALTSISPEIPNLRDYADQLDVVADNIEVLGFQDIEIHTGKIAQFAAMCNQ